MSQNVIIKQKGIFGKKPMPLEIILGGELSYGVYEDGMTLSEGVMGNGDFIAYHPDFVGRGISVYWKEGEMAAIDISLPTPSFKPEIEAFYRMVKRITDYWNCSLEVDGNNMRPSEFQAGLADTIDFNLKAVVHFSEGVLSGEHDELTLYAVFHPLILGKKEAAEFKEQPQNFGAWLHKKQNEDAWYECPRLYQGKNGIIGRFFYEEDLPAIFPNKPFVPFSATDPQTGRMLECNDWSVILFTEKEQIGEVEYNIFLEKLPKNKIEYFDGGHILVKALNKDEIVELTK